MDNTFLSEILYNKVLRITEHNLCVFSSVLSVRVNQYIVLNIWYIFITKGVYILCVVYPVMLESVRNKLSQTNYKHDWERPWLRKRLIITLRTSSKGIWPNNYKYFKLTIMWSTFHDLNVYRWWVEMCCGFFFLLSSKSKGETWCLKSASLAKTKTCQLALQCQPVVWRPYVFECGFGRQVVTQNWTDSNWFHHFLYSVCSVWGNN